MYVWGNNGDGRLGFEDCVNRFVPETPPPFDEACKRVTGIAGGGSHSIVVEESGQLWSCGKGTYGQVVKNVKQVICKVKQVIWEQVVCNNASIM